MSSLLQSHISQFNKDIPDKIWYQIVFEVQNFNQNAGTVNVETLPEDLVKYFKEPEITYIPKGLAKEDAVDNSEVEDEPVATDWNQHASAAKLALAMLIGSWNESNDTDVEVVSRMVGEEYSGWIADLREVLQTRDTPLTYKNGLWSFKDRLHSWQDLGCRLFDDHMDTFESHCLGSPSCR